MVITSFTKRSWSWKRTSIAFCWARRRFSLIGCAPQRPQPVWDQGYDALMVTDTVATLDLPFFCGVVEGLNVVLGHL